MINASPDIAIAKRLEMENNTLVMTTQDLALCVDG